MLTNHNYQKKLILNINKTKVQDIIVYSKENPESGARCGIYNFRKVIK